MKFELQEMTQEQIDTIKGRVEDNSRQIDEIVEGIINPYVKDLDRYVGFVRDCLAEVETRPSDVELEDWCMNLSTFIYFASGMCENLGIRDDIAKAVYKEVYNSSRSSIEKGTVADKDAQAALYSQQEAVISSAYTRAYKMVKSKVESAQELLSSCKKVLSHRMQEMELTHIANN